MDIYVINTNLKYTENDQSQVWLNNNLAFIHTAGPGPKDMPATQHGDQIFMWINNRGIAAIGCIQETWDNCSYTNCMIRFPPSARDTNRFEHRLPVNWYLLLAKPITYDQVRNEYRIPLVTAPTIQRIDKHKEEALELIVRQLSERNWHRCA